MTEPMSIEALHARLGELTEHKLSSSSRIGHLVMTVVAVVVAAAIAYLLLQGDLQAFPILMPMRGIVFLWCMFGVACAWALFGVFLLLRQKQLLPIHEILAAMVAMVFAAVFTGGTLGVVMARSDQGLPSPSHLTGATQLGAAMTVFAFVVWLLALLRHSRLQAMRNRLERELSGN